MAKKKINMSTVKTPMPIRDKHLRARDFGEVELGYTADMAREEALRCLDCKNKPCVSGCPVGIDIPGFIRNIADEDFSGAYKTISKDNALPAVCGRVCPQETQCEKRCVRAIKGQPVAIGRLERFAADYHMQNEDTAALKNASNGFRVAVIGSGPAGLTCAGELNRLGYDVTIYESFHEAGGVLVYGIPQFRLPKEIVKKEIEALENAGVNIVLNAVAGKSFTVDELFEEGYAAVFIGTGAGLPMFLNIEGENLNGVFSANEYLTRINLMKAYTHSSQTPLMPSKNAVIIGGGNVAMDAARCALRIGADATVVYRRGREEMPARIDEVIHAEEEGVNFELLCSPLRILGDDEGWVTGIECIKMKLDAPDHTMRRRPVEIPGSNFIIPADTVILAIGTSPNPIMKDTTQGLSAGSRGELIVDEGWQTTREGVFAGGDAVSGAATVILAMGAGKQAAVSMDKYIKDKYM